MIVNNKRFRAIGDHAPVIIADQIKAALAASRGIADIQTEFAQPGWCYVSNPHPAFDQNYPLGTLESSGGFNDQVTVLGGGVGPAGSVG
ncbi:MAG: hypothetical protein ACD_39C01796G0001, partial [uncultured bacterium]